MHQLMRINSGKCAFKHINLHGLTSVAASSAGRSYQRKNDTRKRGILPFSFYFCIKLSYIDYEAYQKS